MNAEELYEKNEKLVYKAMRLYFPDCANDEDFLQIARIGLWKACTGFDETKDTSFSTFAFACIKNEVFMSIRRGYAKRRTATVVSLDSDVLIESSVEFDDTAVDVDLFADTLTDTEYSVFCYLMERRQPVYSEQLDMSRNEFKETLESIREKYRNFSQEEPKGDTTHDI